MNSSIYVTGVDVITPMTNNFDEFKDQLYDTCSDNIYKQQIDLSELETPFYRKTRRMNRTSVAAFISSTQAYRNRGLDQIEYNPYDIGTIYSTFSASLDSTLNVLDTVYTKGINNVSPIIFAATVGNSCIAGVTMEYKLKGTSMHLQSSNPIGYSYNSLENGSTDMIFCGSYDCYIDNILNYYNNLPFTNNNGLGDCSPYSVEPRGIYLKEALVTLILEKADSKYITAETILCEICGIGVHRKSTEKKDGLYTFENKEFQEAMDSALKNAKVSAEEIDCIVSAAGEHPTIDHSEAIAINICFEKNPPVISIKGIFGDTLGCNLNLNIAAAICILQKQEIPKVFNCGEDIDSININRQNTKGTYKYVLVNGYSEYGSVMSVILKYHKKH
ncbi:beta-ketoacyl synthase N-terminal-like domain-containing protein [Vallitalea guaymasensis]|uniref:beta-ketoacyl synthase N-terminal-like domain-containing protein n=1 Tax=Vallitalea guaymasensis TaxID=1185412 RepID=UPI00235255ED|nr:beta-ketoacyl synthase N-terminal-like domain-containing protein [Vallitalea guaymasensis]